MDQFTCTEEIAKAINYRFEWEMYKFLRAWVRNHEDKTLLQFDQGLEAYLANNALRDFFLTTSHPIQHLLKNRAIASHLGRRAAGVYLEPVSGEPLLSPSEQRIYNLARRMDSEAMHIPFRSVHPKKQTEAGDIACVSTYTAGCKEIYYNSGNHFASRPANGHVFDENSRRCSAKTAGNMHVLFKHGFLEDRLQEVKTFMTALHQMGETDPQFFVICSRHSPTEGHFGVSLVIMEPANPDFPKRVLVCDTLLKELPHHPRWWNHFITEYTHVFGDAVTEIIEDLSHPLQKVNVTGDSPYRHDWDCPYYAASMADALAEVVKNETELALYGSLPGIHKAMKDRMPDYYHPDGVIKDRPGIQQANRLKRWKSGREVVNSLVAGLGRKSTYEI